MGTRKYVVYVRVTHAENEEEGTGPMPLALINAAKEYDAEPHIIRVNMLPAGEGIAFKYWGDDDLERCLKSNTKEWHGILLKGKTVADFRRLVGKINVLELKMDFQAADEALRQLRTRLKNPEDVQSLTAESIMAAADDPDQRAEGVILVDGRDITKHHVSLYSLASSTYQNAEHYIFTCSCGVSGCAGINRGVTVVSDQGLTIWKTYGLRPRRVYLFDQQQYRAEVLTKLRQFINWYKQIEPEVRRDVYFCPLEYLEKALYEAEENQPSVTGRSMGPIWVHDGITPEDDPERIV